MTGLDYKWNFTIRFGRNINEKKAVDLEEKEEARTMIRERRRF